MTVLLGKDENFLGIDNQPNGPEEAGVIVLSVPFEQTSSFGIGSSAGPAAILDASRQVEFFDTGLGFEPVDKLNGIATLPPLEVAECDGGQLAERVQAEVQTWLEKGKCVVTLGGEHASIVGAIYAHSKIYDDLTVIQLDAHSDLRESYQGSPWNHACAMARVRDKNTRLIQVGIRSECREESELVKKYNIPVFYAESIHEKDRLGEDWIAEIIETISGPVYITFDCDVFDPSIMPATGTPEPAGLLWTQVDLFFRRLSENRRIVGFDVSELAPVPGLHHPQFTVAKLLYRLLGYISLHRTI